MSGYVLLEDGARFDGELRRRGESVTGEVVFNTAMTGYQESVTDPSYAGQIITFTYPLIGNYGVAQAAMESDRAQARGVIMREGKNSEDAAEAEGGWLDWLRDCGVPAISGVDTRALVRHIRDRGAMRGGIFAGGLPEAEARERVEAEPSMEGADLARDGDSRRAGRARGSGPHVVGHRHRDQALDHPAISRARLPGDAAAVHGWARGRPWRGIPTSSSSPTARATRRRSTTSSRTVRELVGKRPVFGICLGHQLLCRAVGLETFKLPFGHRGANHPVKDLATGRIEITSQNHGFAVAGAER